MTCDRCKDGVLEEWIAAVANAEGALIHARRALSRAVRRAKAEHGWSWTDVGQYFDISKQAAQQRFGRDEANP